jgi:hypothetical protein
MTYTELVNAIQEYTENYEQTFVDNIPVFLRQTETRVYNTVQVPALRANKTGILSSNNKYLSAPGDFLAVYSMAVIENYGTATEEYHYLLNKDVNYIRELHYYYYPESITTAPDGRTWLGDNYDPILLYGALREAYLFMKGEQDLIANVEAKYNEAMGQLKRLGDGMERQDAYRSGQVRVRVT